MFFPSVFEQQRHYLKKTGHFQGTTFKRLAFFKGSIGPAKKGRCLQKTGPFQRQLFWNSEGFAFQKLAFFQGSLFWPAKKGTTFKRLGVSKSSFWTAKKGTTFKRLALLQKQFLNSKEKGTTFKRLAFFKGGFRPAKKGTTFKRVAVFTSSYWTAKKGTTFKRVGVFKSSYWTANKGTTFQRLAFFKNNFWTAKALPLKDWAFSKAVFEQQRRHYLQKTGPFQRQLLTSKERHLKALVQAVYGWRNARIVRHVWYMMYVCTYDICIFTSWRRKQITTTKQSTSKNANCCAALHPSVIKEEMCKYLVGMDVHVHIMSRAKGFRALSLVIAFNC